MVWMFFSKISDPAVRGGLLEIILVVTDAENFHRNNLQIHPHHHATWLRPGGASTASWMQRNFFLLDTKVLFHVVDDQVPMKYGVVQQDDLFQDLTEWEYLYLAGRLHKPTLPIMSPPDSFSASSCQFTGCRSSCIAVAIQRGHEPTHYLAYVLQSNSVAELHRRLSNADGR
jgi:hypothetical protein